jgi:hypothetical protein
VQYDHPYNGKIVVNTLNTLAEVYQFCGLSRARAGVQ